MCRQATMRFWSGEMSTLWREPSSKKHLDVPCAESKSIHIKCCTWKTFDIVCHPQRPWLHRNSQNKASQTLWMVCNVVWREDVLSIWLPNLPRHHLIAVTAWEVHLQVPKATHRSPATPCIQHIRVCTILQVFASCHHTTLSGSIWTLLLHCSLAQSLSQNLSMRKQLWGWATWCTWQNSEVDSINAVKPTAEVFACRVVSFLSQT